MNPLARNVRTLRGRLQLSQVELASECGLDPETVSRIETGLATKPQAGTLARLAEALKTTVAILEGYESTTPVVDNGSAGGPSVHEHTDQSGADSTVQHSPDQVRSASQPSDPATPAGEQPPSAIASPGPGNSDPPLPGP